MKKLLSLLLCLALLLPLAACGGGSVETQGDASGEWTVNSTGTTLRYGEENITPTLADGSAASIEKMQGWDDGSLDAFGYREWYHSEDGGDTWETRTVPEDFLAILCVDGEGALYGLGQDKESEQYVLYQYTADGETETLPLDSGIESFSCCAIYDNRIAFVKDARDAFSSTLYAVELATGTTLWQRESDSPSPTCFCYDGALYLYESAYPLLALDPETGEELGEYGEDFMCNTTQPLLAENGYYFFLDEDNFNLCRGIFNSKIYEVVLDAADYRYSLECLEGYTPLSGFYMDEDYTLYLTTYEGSLYRFAVGTEAVEADSTFTIWALNETDTLREAVLAFQEAHPELDVELEVQLDEDGSAEGSATVSDILSNLNTQLLAGDGPDVLILDDVDYQTYIDKGVLEPLNDLYQEYDFVGGTVSTLLTEAGDCYVIPARFSMPVIMTDQGELPTTMEELTERVLTGGGRSAEQATEDDLGWEENAYLLLQPSGEFYSVWLAASGGSLVTEDGVDASALTTWLNDLKQISDHYDLTDGVELAGSSSGSSYEGFSYGNRNEYFPSDGWWGDGAAGVMVMNDVQSLLGQMVAICSEYDEETGETAISPDPKRFQIARCPGLTEGAYSPEMLMAVTAGSSQTELAKEFIETALSDDVQRYTYGDGLPVTQAGIDAQLDYFSDYAEQCGWDISALEAIFDSCTAPVTLELEVQDALYKAANGLCLGEIDLDGAVTQIEDDFALKIAEK
ncbi:MAG: extracellular solute-binding protein [Clostridiales bacterium]|nr:extracellular solute-binding protein [Clostridiales bacterium]